MTAAYELPTEVSVRLNRALDRIDALEARMQTIENAYDRGYRDGLTDGQVSTERQLASHRPKPTTSALLDPSIPRVLALDSVPVVRS